MLHVHLGEMVSQPLHTIYVQVRITARIYHPWTCPHTCSDENADWSNKTWFFFFFVYVQNVSSENMVRTLKADFCTQRFWGNGRKTNPNKFMSINPRLINCNSLPDSYITLLLIARGYLSVYNSNSQILICQKWISVWPYEQSRALRGGGIFFSTKLKLLIRNEQNGYLNC